jgi:Branched-chain amino acid permeases
VGNEQTAQHHPLDVALGTPTRPSWRGRLQQIGLWFATPLVIALTISADGARPRVGAIGYAVGLSRWRPHGSRPPSAPRSSSLASSAPTDSGRSCTSRWDGQVRYSCRRSGSAAVRSRSDASSPVESSTRFAPSASPDGGRGCTRRDSPTTRCGTPSTSPLRACTSQRSVPSPRDRQP